MLVLAIFESAVLVNEKNIALLTCFQRLTAVKTVLCCKVYEYIKETLFFDDLIGIINTFSES